MNKKQFDEMPLQTEFELNGYMCVKYSDTDYALVIDEDTGELKKAPDKF